MGVKWMGWHPIHFPNGAALTTGTGSGLKRTSWAPFALAISTPPNIGKSETLPAVMTDGWWTGRLETSSNPATSSRFFGMGSSAADCAWMVGVSASSNTKIALWKRNSGVYTEVASESGTSYTNSVVHRIDVGFGNYGRGSAGFINVYFDDVLVIAYSADISLTGASGLDQFWITSNGVSASWNSELAIMDDDARDYPGIFLGMLTGDGTTTDWTGDFSTINGNAIVETTPNSTNATGQKQQFDFTNIPSGVYEVAAYRVSVWAAHSAGSTATQAALGYNDGGVSRLGPALAVGTAYGTVSQLFTTGLPTLGNLNALQAEAESR